MNLGRLAVIVAWLWASAGLAAPGDIDTGFGDGGSIPAGGPVLTMPDGRLIVGRRIADGFEVVAYDQTGTQRDPSFGTAGRTFVSIPASDNLGGPASRAADGKLLFSGERTATDGTKIRVILRLTTSGNLDLTFGVRADGSVDLPDFKSVVGVVGLQDGRTLVLEWKADCFDGGIGGYSCNGPLVVWRLLSSGSVDRSFGDNGSTLIPESDGSGGWAVLFGVRPDGSILVGDSSSTPTLAVLTPAGAIDTTFDAAVAKGSEGWWHRGVMLPDGGLLLTGVTGVGNILENWDTRLLKLRPDGRVDTSFGNGSGVVTLNLSGLVSTRLDLVEGWPEIALSPDGSRVYLQSIIEKNVVGADFRCLAITRLNLSGVVDATFGKRGVTCVTNSEPYVSFVDRLATQASGEPLLVFANEQDPSFQPAIYRLRLDNVPSSGIISNSLVVRGPDESIGILAIKVTRTAGKNGAVSIAYATEAMSATAGEDYVSVSGRLDWADGDDTDRTINITIRDDTVKEDRESFLLKMSSPTGGPLLLDSTQTVNIYDNDAVASPLPATSPTVPISSGAGGGGGGAIQLPALLFLAGLGALVVLRRNANRGRAASELGMPSYSRMPRVIGSDGTHGRLRVAAPPFAQPFGAEKLATMGQGSSHR
jgi:uncharacterized delta-60 repeat protein